MIKRCVILSMCDCNFYLRLWPTKYFTWINVSTYQMLLRYFTDKLHLENLRSGLLFMSFSFTRLGLHINKNRKCTWPKFGLATCIFFIFW